MFCKLGSKISSGSFGDVYKVECKDPETADIKSKENYAIKIIQNSVYGIRCISELLILLFLKYEYLMNCYQNALQQSPRQKFYFHILNMQ